MKGCLSQNQINYVLFHVNQIVEVSTEIQDRMVFIIDHNDINKHSGKIIFLLSDKEFRVEEVKMIGEIPILFPILDKQEFYSYRGTNLVFSDDILKSAFYLLSGYQEYKFLHRDHLNRFPFDESVQKRLKIMHKPIVNYYFKVFQLGIEQFCFVENIKFKKSKKLFSDFGFLLSHDVDRIDYYDGYFLGYKVKELLGMVKRKYSWFLTLKLFLKGITQYFKFWNRENPYWNFDFLRQVESENDFKSTFFFLPKDQKHVDSYYELSELRIISLIKNLQNQGCEIGLHGAVRTVRNRELMIEHNRELNNILGQRVKGIRQHRLIFEIPGTSIIQSESGFKYDASLGFASHEGFRNSYCFPFKLYDFENDRMIDHWEFPLMVMDSTLFEYRKLNFEEAFSILKDLISEAKKFHGIFTLLWHNSYFDELKHKGITAFYKNMLKEIKLQNAESILGSDLLNRL